MLQSKKILISLFSLNVYMSGGFPSFVLSTVKISLFNISLTLEHEEKS